MTLSPAPRSTLRRHRERAGHDPAELYTLLDSVLVCHLGLVLDGSPAVLPTGYGRDGDTLYLHGSSGAVSLMAASQGAPVCVTVTQLHGVVYARSAFHHSMNYASAVIHGTARKVTDDKELRHGLRTLVEHLAPGSWEQPPAHPQGARRHHGAGRAARRGFDEGPDRTTGGRRLRRGGRAGVGGRGRACSR